jgi:urease subunit beta
METEQKKVIKDSLMYHSGWNAVKIKVLNLSNKPIEVTSDCHFYEVDRLLSFDRLKAYGRKLNIPTGNEIRFYPGEIKIVELVPISIERKMYRVK